MKNDFDVIMIGSGIGALTCASLLAHVDTEEEKEAREAVVQAGLLISGLARLASKVEEEKALMRESLNRLHSPV